MERRKSFGERKSSLFYLCVLFEGDVSWQGRRGSKINAAKGGSDSLSAGCGSLGWPDWSWMSLLLLNLVYVSGADSGKSGGAQGFGKGGGGAQCLQDNNRKDKL